MQRGPRRRGVFLDPSWAAKSASAGAQEAGPSAPMHGARSGVVEKIHLGQFLPLRVSRLRTAAVASSCSRRTEERAGQAAQDPGTRRGSRGKQEDFSDDDESLSGG